ncbi:hypothetical protein AAD001_17960 [Colwelliaceae bacterium 6471]
MKTSGDKNNPQKKLSRCLLDSMLAMTLGFLFIIPVLWFCIFVITSESTYNSFMSLLEYLDFIAIMFFAIGLPIDLFNRTRIKRGGKSI